MVSLTAPERLRAKASQNAQEAFDEALANGSMRIRYMTKAERKTGIVKVRMKPKRRRVPS